MNGVRNKALLNAVWRFHQDHIDHVLDGFECALSEVIEQLPQIHKDVMDDSFVWWPESGYNSESSTQYTKLLGWFILICDLSAEDTAWVLQGVIEDATVRNGPDDKLDIEIDECKFFNLLEKSCS